MAVNRLPFDQIGGAWSISGGNFDDPTEGHHYSQPFAWDIRNGTTEDPVLGWDRSVVSAARAGHVIDVRTFTPSPKMDMATSEWAAGNYVLIRHVDGTTFTYAHLANEAPNPNALRTIFVSPGDYVLQGQTLGICGDTGNSTGRHLHIEAHTWKRVFTPGKGYAGWRTGASLLVHFEDPAHKQPWRPVHSDAFSHNALELRQDGWRRCDKCAGLFFQDPYQFGYQYKREHGICPAGGGHSHDSWYMYSLSLDSRSGGQQNWYFCRKCRVLFKANINSVCPVKTPFPLHDPSESGNYRIPMNAPNSPGQTNWRECHKCHGLYQTDTLPYPPCPDGGRHVSATSANYTVHVSAEDTQQRWRICAKCRGLFYTANRIFAGTCPRDGGEHRAGKDNYTLSMNVSPINAQGPRQARVPPASRGWQPGWRFCNLCNGLYYGPGVNESSCAGAQVLDLSTDRHKSLSSRRYNLLIWHGELKPGDTVSNWRWCWRCQGLWHQGTAQQSESWCPRGGQHRKTGSAMYLVFWDRPIGSFDQEFQLGGSDTASFGGLGGGTIPGL